MELHCNWKLKIFAKSIKHSGLTKFNETIILFLLVGYEIGYSQLDPTMHTYGIIVECTI